MSGAILNAPAGLSPGQHLRLRMQMNEGDTELVEVMGEAIVNDDVALMTGLEFDIDVARMTRTLSSPPPELPEGFSELPTLHMPQSPQILESVEAPPADVDDAPRAVTMPTDTAVDPVDLGPDAEQAFEDELSDDVDSDVFADADDDIFRSQGDAEPSQLDEDPIELTRLEQEIAALDASIDPTMTQPAPPPPVDDEEVARMESELASLEAVLDAAAAGAVSDDGTEDRPEKPRSGFEDDERQTTRERMAGHVQLEISDEARVGEPAPYERPGFGFDPASAEDEPEIEEEPTLDEPTGIVGNLREMSLCELVQSMEISRKTAQVVVSPKDDESGSVFVENGRVRWAEQGEIEGEEAFYRLGRAFSGSFRMRFGVKPPGENVSQPTPYLVLEALRRMDEGRASGELAIPVLEHVEKERLPSAREVVKRAQRAHSRHERRRVKTQPPARPKSVPPQPALPPPLPAEAADIDLESIPPSPAVIEPSIDEHSLDVREVQQAAAAVVGEREERTERTQPRKGGLFASFFDEASQADNVLDDDDTALARVLSSSDEGRPAKPAR